LYAATGYEAWVKYFSTDSFVESAPAVAYGNVYVGSISGLIYCLDAATGNTAWTYTTSGSVYSSPSVASGNVYIGSYDHRVYCLDAATGGLKWSYYTDGIVKSAPAIADGKLYVPVNDKVIAFGFPIGLTVQNFVDVAPLEGWNYQITETMPDYTVVDLGGFTLRAAGGDLATFTSSTFTSGGTFTITATPKYGYETGISWQTDPSTYGVEDEILPNVVTVDLAPGGWAGVTVGYAKAPTFTNAPVGQIPPGEMTYTPSPFKVTPVQAAWNPDKNQDGRIDLVAGKPTTVLVNLAGVTSPVSLLLTCTDVTQSSPALPSPVPISYTPGAATCAIVAFPSITIDTATSSPRDVILSVAYTSGTGPQIESTTVTVRKANDLSLYYGYLHRTGYNDPTNYVDTVTESNLFMTSTYPVKAVSANTAQNKINGGNSMLTDCMAIANIALKKNYAVGVAITSSGQDGYFNKWGQPNAVGVSYGPNVKGVIVAEDFWTAAAHEIGHTYNLYWETPEEYSQYPLYGQMASGVSAVTGNWRSGQDFMGCAPYRTLDNTWVNSGGTFNPLFTKLTQTLTDPTIVVASGIFHSDGSFEMPFTWSELQGTPSQIESGESGNYALKFLDAANHEIPGTQVPFEAKPRASVSVGVTLGMDRPDTGSGTIPSDDAGFCFATVLPDNTAAVQIVDGQGAVKETVLRSEIVDVAPVTTETETGSKGLNGWYVSPVGVSLIATAEDGIGMKEIHYVLDSGTEIVTQGDTASLTITTDGTHSLTYWAVDNIARAESPHTTTIKIDHTAPNVFIGFLEPINNAGDSVFKLKSTVPVKFQLKDSQGNYVSTAVASIKIAKLSNQVWGDDSEPVSTSAATTGNLFRYDATSCQYIFNLSTKGLSMGSWRISVVLYDCTTETVIIGLR